MLHPVPALLGIDDRYAAIEEAARVACYDVECVSLGNGGDHGVFGGDGAAGLLAGRAELGVGGRSAVVEGYDSASERPLEEGVCGLLQTVAAGALRQLPDAVDDGGQAYGAGGRGVDGADFEPCGHGGV